MNLYLDIDGVLLTKDGKIPNHGQKFIEFAVDRFECFWLTTHCRGGENKAVDYLAQYYPFCITQLLGEVKPTDWDTLKTEAIDFSMNFIWLEDAPFESEIRILENMGVLSSLIKVNLKKDNELMSIRNELFCAY
jgi:hypothetical protein